jgi:hypothetical protein
MQERLLLKRLSLLQKLHDRVADDHSRRTDEDQSEKFENEFDLNSIRRSSRSDE